jgi:hypothetical protein
MLQAEAAVVHHALSQGLALHQAGPLVNPSRRILVLGFRRSRALIGLGSRRCISPAFFERNFALKKISESFNVQFRAEFFNIFNHANFAPPLPFNGSGNAQIFLANGTSANAGGLQSRVTLPRDIQFALKVMW